MKRIYAYIIAGVLTIAFGIGEYYYETDHNLIDPDTLESEKYLDTSDIDEILDNVSVPEEIDNFVQENGSLTIKNTQNDDVKIAYTYKIKVTDVTGAHRYSYNGQEKYIIFAATGEAEITLNSNESVTIYELPLNNSFEISQEGGNTKKYTIKANNVVGTNTKGSIEEGTTVTFTNNLIVKDESPNESNPVTADAYTIAIILFAIVTFIYIAIRQVKIKRFE